MLVGQSQKEATVNEALVVLDMLVGGGVEGVRNSPPSSPVTGQVWIVGNLPTGAFSGQASALASWSDGGWRFVLPSRGLRVQDLEAGAMRIFADDWQLANAPAAPAGGAVIDVEARDAISAIIAALKVVGIFSTPV
ncbi:DUF2793 domain-containing protein [Novosphingobium sp. ERN07]|nr:DUF2793 domain-containing protein [Novosphingobium sp. ERN07]NLR69318.1 DUF2793 domain-containing protein [Novosphingobium sp. ERN07]